MELDVESIEGPPNQFVLLPVPGVQVRSPSPFCHSQRLFVGSGPKSQKISSAVAVCGGTVTVGYLKIQKTKFENKIYFSHN